MQHEQSLPQVPHGSGNAASCGIGGILKQRLRWTPELHKRFVEAVEELGGAESECFCIVRSLVANVAEYCHNVSLISLCRGDSEVRAQFDGCTWSSIVSCEEPLAG